jgi:hypothetical protein
VGFGGEFGGSRAARADDTDVLACLGMETVGPSSLHAGSDRAAHTTALGTADAAK